MLMLRPYFKVFFGLVWFGLVGKGRGSGGRDLSVLRRVLGERVRVRR
jgi:hypothetical protein